MIGPPPSSPPFPYPTLFRSFRQFPDALLSLNRLAAERFLRGDRAYAPPPPPPSPPPPLGPERWWGGRGRGGRGGGAITDRESTRLNSSHLVNSYAVFCLTKK